jgi:hypothetical protein
LQDYEDQQEEQEEVVDRQQLLRQVLRSTHAAEVSKLLPPCWQIMGTRGSNGCLAGKCS